MAIAENTLNLLAFDLGGSGGKLMEGRFDGSRIGLSELIKFDNRPVPINRGLYWDIEGIYRFLLQGLRKAAAAGPVYSLGIDSFSNDFGLVDKNGELLTPVRCYRDDRTVRHADYVYSRVSKRKLYELTGNQNARFNTLMQMGAMQAAGQGWILEHARRFLFVPDLLIYFLTGEALAEYTIASVSQFFSFASQNFCEELLAAFNLRRDLFGPVSMPGSPAGTIGGAPVQDQGLPPCRVVSICEHDTASAYLASPLNSENTIIISSGTWSLMGCELKAPLISEEGFHYNIANEGGYPGHHRFLRNVMGSWIIQEIRADYQAMGTEYSFADLEKAAEGAEPFVHFIDVDEDAFFSPGGIPEKIRKDCGKRGKIPESAGALTRCVYESLAMKYRRNLDILERVTGKTFETINIVGGGSRDGFLCRCTANACGRPVVAGPREATALGNMLVQLIAAGKIASVEEGRNVIAASFPPVRYEPQEASRWEAEYRRYCALFPE
ncbi:MAG: rhamnulokinase [Spirochaetaceae bacterium]|jgi:sugar (pentulose or hexulose) kinase|nr:rhamnulokinase [Spirochaetaceae bacterium]